MPQIFTVKVTPVQVIDVEKADEEVRTLEVTPPQVIGVTTGPVVPVTLSVLTQPEVYNLIA